MDTKDNDHLLALSEAMKRITAIKRSGDEMVQILLTDPIAQTPPNSELVSIVVELWRRNKGYVSDLALNLAKIQVHGLERQANSDNSLAAKIAADDLSKYDPLDPIAARAVLSTAAKLEPDVVKTLLERVRVTHYTVGVGNRAGTI